MLMALLLTTVAPPPLPSLKTYLADSTLRGLSNGPPAPPFFIKT